MATPTDKELEELNNRMKQMEEESTRLRELQDQLDIDMQGAPAPPSEQEKEEADRRSIHVGNVAPGVTADQMRDHFEGCGTISRVTIMRDHHTGLSRGFAFIEFSDLAAVANAAALNDTFLSGQAIRVTPKRTNIPGFSRPWRGRGARGSRGGGASFRGGMPPHYYYMPPYSSMPYYGANSSAPLYAYMPYGYPPQQPMHPYRGRGYPYRGGAGSRHNAINYYGGTIMPGGVGGGAPNSSHVLLPPGSASTSSTSSSVAPLLSSSFATLASSSSSSTTTAGAIPSSAAQSHQPQLSSSLSSASESNYQQQHMQHQHQHPHQHQHQNFAPPSGSSAVM